MLWTCGILERSKWDDGYIHIVLTTSSDECYGEASIHDEYNLDDTWARMVSHYYVESNYRPYEWLGGSQGRNSRSSVLSSKISWTADSLTLLIMIVHIATTKRFAGKWYFCKALPAGYLSRMCSRNDSCKTGQWQSWEGIKFCNNKLMTKMLKYIFSIAYIKQSSSKAKSFWTRLEYTKIS